ncbi:MAG: acyltransferase [Mariprofundaceae bacterium]|nr:acyltransferase [Mariprofundaceae bacterium]
MKIFDASFLSRAIFKLRYQIFGLGYLRSLYWKILGMRIGHSTRMAKIFVSWPHQVSIGNNCLLEHYIYFHFDGIYRIGSSIVIGDSVFIGTGCEFNISDSVMVGDNCLIASGCKFIDHNHDYSKRDMPINTQSSCVKGCIILENDVWLGVNVVVLKGVTIEKGSIVAAGSVVTKSIPSYEIWGGVPAKRIGNRP